LKTFQVRLKVVGGIRNQAFRTLKIKECFSRSDSRAKGPAAKSQEPLNLFSFSEVVFRPEPFVASGAAK
jgi:hypothetical protein